MSIRTRFARLLARGAKGLMGQSFSTADEAFAQFFGQPTYAGKSVNNTVAMQQSTVFTCQRVIAETFGSLSGACFQRDRLGNVTRVDQHDLSGIMFDTPNADMDKVNFQELIGGGLALQGNSYHYRNARADGSISSLYPLPLTEGGVDPKRLDNGDIVFRVHDRGKYETLPRDKVWQVKGFGADALCGYSPIGLMRQMVGMALATEEWQARFFANGAMPTFLVSVPAFLPPEQRKQAREILKETWGGAQNAYTAKLLEGGMTATPATMPLNDAQFLELRGATKEDIIGWYRIPPHMAGDLSRSTNNNIEQQAIEFVMYCMLPYLTRVEASARRWLMTPADRAKGLFIRYNVESLLRADSAQRGELMSKQLQNGVRTRNEWRVLEGMNRSDAPGMDDYTVQTQLVPVDVLRKTAERAATAPAPAAVTPPGKDALDAALLHFKQLVERV